MGAYYRGHQGFVRCVCALCHHPWRSYSVFVRLILFFVRLALVSHYQFRSRKLVSFRLAISAGPSRSLLWCVSSELSQIARYIGSVVRLICSWKLFAIAKARCCLLMSGASRCFRTGHSVPGIFRTRPIRKFRNGRRVRYVCDWLQHQGLSSCPPTSYSDG